MTISALFCFSVFLVTFLWAQEEIYTLAHSDVFGELRREPVVFLHLLHEEALEVEGCDICHHTPDKQTGKLLSIEDEELSCMECHGEREKGSIPALREAYHGSCTPCHRTRQKEKNKKSGPTTCGECHKRL